MVLGKGGYFRLGMGNSTPKEGQKMPCLRAISEYLTYNTDTLFYDTNFQLNNE